MGTVSKLNQLKLPGIAEQARASIYPEDFLWFWSEYPNKQNKLDALKAWQQTADLRPPVEQVIAAIATQLRSYRWTKHGGEYIPYPASWLRAGGWDNGE